MNGINVPTGTRKAIVNNVAVHFIHGDFKGQIVDLGGISWECWDCSDYLRLYLKKTENWDHIRYLNSMSLRQWQRLVREIMAEARLRTPSIFPVY